MTDLTPERRAELREHAEAERPAGWLGLDPEDLIALLDAVDERDRLAEVESRLSVLLWRLTNGHLSKTTYPVEFMEQEIEECLARYHESDLRDERGRLAAAVERARALHAPEPFEMPNGEVWYRCGRCQHASNRPCPTRRALDGTEDGPTT